MGLLCPWKCQTLWMAAFICVWLMQGVSGGILIVQMVSVHCFPHALKSLRLAQPAPMDKSPVENLDHPHLPKVSTITTNHHSKAVSFDIFKIIRPNNNNKLPNQVVACASFLYNLFCQKKTLLSSILI